MKEVIGSIKNIITSYCEGIYHVEFEFSDLDKMVKNINTIGNYDEDVLKDIILSYCEGTEHLSLTMDDVEEIENTILEL